MNVVGRIEQLTNNSNTLREKINSFEENIMDKMNEKMIDDFASKMKNIINKLEDELSKTKETLVEGNPIEKIERAYCMDKLKYDIDDYKNYNFDDKKGELFRLTFGPNGIEKTVTVAKQHADSLYEKSLRIHEDNIVKIENNKKIIEKITIFMKAVGIPSNYSVYEYKTSRSRNKTHINKIAGWQSDIYNFICVDDGFELVRKRYNDFLKKIEDYKIKKQEEKKKYDAEKEKKQSQEKKIKMLAIMIVKYALSDDSTWDDVIEAIISKDKYLRLAYFLQKNRNDWSEGYEYASRGLDGFIATTDSDAEISLPGKKPPSFREGMNCLIKTHSNY